MNMSMDKNKKTYLATGAVVLLAVALVLLKYWDYVVNPWTRDGQVWANVIQIAPRVSGPIVELADQGQPVRQGRRCSLSDRPAHLSGRPRPGQGAAR